MSLFEMVNCNISALAALCSQLMLEQTCHEFDEFRKAAEAPVQDAEKIKIRKWLTIASTLADEFEWQAVHHRIKLIQERLDGKKGTLTNLTLAHELGVLRETIDHGLEWQLIYRYPNDKASVLQAWKADWSQVIKKFPSAQSDIFSGVDLWSLGHSTASVFHFMRTLEHGLRALAGQLGVSFGVQNWQNVIDQIDAEVRAQGKTLRTGEAKNQRLQFLSEAAKELVYFKDGWRNYVSHARGVYDSHQARSVMEHTKAFMTTLSTQLSEPA
jgi:hypothetical protein